MNDMSVPRFLITTAFSFLHLSDPETHRQNILALQPCKLSRLPICHRC